LELAFENFSVVPSYARKEILVIYSSITNCDPSNVFNTFAKLNEKEIRCSVISLSAAIYVLEKLA
jgi:transcription initiation factor TFIIH subunit 2